MPRANALRRCTEDLTCVCWSFPKPTLRHGGELVDRIAPLMKEGGQIIVSVINRRLSGRRDRNDRNFDENVTFQSARLIKSGVVPTEVRFVPANIARRLVRRGMFEPPELDEQTAVAQRAAGRLRRGLLSVCPYRQSRFAASDPSRKPARPHIEFHHAVGGRRAVNRSQPNGGGGCKLAIEEDDQSAEAQTARPAADLTLFSEETREPQYNRCIELKGIPSGWLRWD
jgi:hypothetical protein